jgi:hypothetical protein
LILRIVRLRKRVRAETVEALQILRQEFSSLITTLEQSADVISKSRKNNNLTKTESELVEKMRTSLSVSENKVRKEIEDVSDLVNKRQDKAKHE